MYFDKEEKHYNPYGLKYFGKESSDEAFTVLKNNEFFIAIGDNNIRQKIYENFASSCCMPVNAIHPSAVIDPRAILAKHGIMISSHVSVNALSSIGKAVICNTGSIIEHECEIGDFGRFGSYLRKTKWWRETKSCGLSKKIILKIYTLLP